jgi:hypothetical protein
MGLKTRVGCGDGCTRVRVRVGKSQPWKNLHPQHRLKGLKVYEVSLSTTGPGINIFKHGLKIK